MCAQVLLSPGGGAEDLSPCFKLATADTVSSSFRPLGAKSSHILSSVEAVPLPGAVSDSAPSLLSVWCPDGSNLLHAEPTSSQLTHRTISCKHCPGAEQEQQDNVYTANTR